MADARLRTTTVLGKIALTGVAVGAGVVHRLRTLRKLMEGQPLPVQRLAAVEITIMDAVLVLAVLLSHAD